MLPIGTISPIVNLNVWQKALGKADQLTLASGGIEHAQLFSITISWANKMNFSLCTNMAGFNEPVT